MSMPFILTTPLDAGTIPAMDLISRRLSCTEIAPTTQINSPLLDLQRDTVQGVRAIVRNTKSING